MQATMFIFFFLIYPWHICYTLLLFVQNKTKQNKNKTKQNNEGYSKAGDAKLFWDKL